MLTVLNGCKHMNMIWHNNVVINVNAWVYLIDFLNLTLNKNPALG